MKVSWIDLLVLGAPCEVQLEEVIAHCPLPDRQLTSVTLNGLVELSGIHLAKLDESVYTLVCSGDGRQEKHCYGMPRDIPVLSVLLCWRQPYCVLCWAGAFR